MWPWDPELGSVSESLLVVLNLIDLYGRFVGQKFETVQKNKQTIKQTGQDVNYGWTYLDPSGSWGTQPSYVAHAARLSIRLLIQTQAVNILGPSYCSLTLKEMGHIPETHFLNFLTLPGYWSPGCWSKIHSTLLSSWACIALGSFKKHPGQLSLVLLVFSLLFLVISLGAFWMLSVGTLWSQISRAVQPLMLESHCWLC